MGSELLLVVVIVVALGFDFTNGFHDTANAMATSIATRALRPKVALALAAVLNFAGAFISIAVATTIAEGIVSNSEISLEVILAGLLGAIAWNLLTWLLGLPSSSSHALIGGLVGAAFAAGGSKAVQIDGVISNVLIPALIAPLVCGALATVATFVLYRLKQRTRDEHADRGFRFGQIGSASLVSLAHGTNDAQKTMGVITLALIVHGSLPKEDFAVPLWVKLAAATAIATGSYVGGWRLIRTLGSKITDIAPPQGFAAEASTTSVLLTASYYGFPLSTTQVVSGGIFGAGLGRRLAEVRWGLAGQMVIAWLLTVPAAALVAAGAFELNDVLGETSAGPIVVSILAVAAGGTLFALAQRNRVTAADV
jgi:PiT family inorganic phosphate transporter